MLLPGLCIKDGAPGPLVCLELQSGIDPPTSLSPNLGNIRVIARVRPVTKEDGEGPEATNAVTFDPDDDSIIHLLHKGKPVSFELDKVFSPWASQQDVSVAPRTGYLWGHGRSNRGKDRHRTGVKARWRKKTT